MITITTATTKRLEGYARGLGLDFRIVKSPDNSLGQYFAVAVNGYPCVRWIVLGWTRSESTERISELAYWNSQK